MNRASFVISPLTRSVAPYLSHVESLPYTTKLGLATSTSIAPALI
jgi:hypothetical protein